MHPPTTLLKHLAALLCLLVFPVVSLAGEAALLAGRTNEARNWYRKCVGTGLIFDVDTSTLDPMNEYHLALWRLDSLDEAEEPP